MKVKNDKRKEEKQKKKEKAPPPVKEETKSGNFVQIKLPVFIDV